MNNSNIDIDIKSSSRGLEFIKIVSDLNNEWKDNNEYIELAKTLSSKYSDLCSEEVLSILDTETNVLKSANILLNQINTLISSGMSLGGEEFNTVFDRLFTTNSLNENDLEASNNLGSDGSRLFNPGEIVRIRTGAAKLVCHGFNDLLYCREFSKLVESVTESSDDIQSEILRRIFEGDSSDQKEFFSYLHNISKKCAEILQRIGEDQEKYSYIQAKIRSNLSVITGTITPLLLNSEVPYIPGLLGKVKEWTSVLQPEFRLMTYLLDLEGEE